MNQRIDSILRKSDDQLSDKELNSMNKCIYKIMNILDETLDVSCSKLEKILNNELQKENHMIVDEDIIHHQNHQNEYRYSHQY